MHCFHAALVLSVFIPFLYFEKFSGAIVSLSSSIFTETTAKRRCLISDYVPSPQETNITQGIQAALNDCAQGGTIFFDLPGIYRPVGALRLTGKDVTVNIPSGVILQASTERNAYGPGGKDTWYLFRLHACHRCKLVGGGCLDGAAGAWVTRHVPGRSVVTNFDDPSCAQLPDECRPRLLGVVDSRAVSISDLRLRDPIYWALHILGSHDVNVTGVHIHGDWNIPNNDGIDVDSSTQVKIANCHVDTADDGICLKTTRERAPLRDVTVRNCTLRSRSAALKIGSESLSDVEHVIFRDIVIRDAHRGLGVQLRDPGSIVRDVTFSNIDISTRYMHPSWWGAAEMVSITAMPRTRGARVGSIAGPVVMEGLRGDGENGIVLVGCEASPIKGVVVRQSKLQLRWKTKWPGGAQDYRPSVLGLVESGCTAGVWVQHAEDVVFKNVTMEFERPFRPDWKECAHVDSITTHGVDLEGITFQGGPPLPW
jgi:hypothetical protein